MHFKKITLLLIIIVTVSVFTAKAQSSLPDTAYYSRQKWEIGTDLLWLINKNTIPASNIFIRRNVTYGENKLGAFRLRLGFNYNSKDFAEVNTIGQEFPDYTIDYTVYSRVGYERQKPMGKFQLFYGADVQMQYVRHKDEKTKYIGTQPDAYPETTLIRQNTFEPGLIGFIGIKYFLSPHFAVSSEINTGLYFQHFKYYLITYDNNLGYDPDDITSFGYSQYRINSWKVNFQPLSVLNFSYYF